MAHHIPAPFTSVEARLHGKAGLRRRPDYRCVYCKRRMYRDQLFAHEVQCDARLIVRREWATQIDQARRAEARRARLIAAGEEVV